MIGSTSRIEAQLRRPPRTVQIIRLGNQRHESFRRDLGRRIVLAGGFMESVVGYIVQAICNGGGLRLLLVCHWVCTAILSRTAPRYGLGAVIWDGTPGCRAFMYAVAAV